MNAREAAISQDQAVALLESELEIAPVLDRIDLSIVITRMEYGSPRPIIVYSNAATTRLIGFEPEELIGKGAEVWQGPDVDLADIIEIGERLRRGETVSIYPDAVRKDGSRVRVEVVMAPIPTASAAYVLSVARDLSDSSSAGEVLTFGDLSMDLGTQKVVRGDEALALTPTEFALLEIFLRHPGEVLARAFLFDRLWGFDPGPTSRTLEVYIGYLRRKIEVGGKPRLIHTVRGSGYVLRESSPED